jgi:hypothetical protein
VFTRYAVKHICLCSLHQITEPITPLIPTSPSPHITAATYAPPTPHHIINTTTTILIAITNYRHH